MRSMRTIAALASLVLIGAGCLSAGPEIPSVERITLPPPVRPAAANGGTRTAPPPETGYPSGVRGIVTLQSCISGVCGEQPYAADLRIATKSGTPVKKFRTASDGGYAVSLVPGMYVIGQPTGAPSAPNAQDKEFTVMENSWAEVDILFK